MRNSHLEIQKLYQTLNSETPLNQSQSLILQTMKDKYSSTKTPVKSGRKGSEHSDTLNHPHTLNNFNSNFTHNQSRNEYVSSARNIQRDFKKNQNIESKLVK